MRSTEPKTQSEESLRRENEELRRQLEALRTGGGANAPSTPAPWKPSATTIVALALIALIVTVVAFFACYLPMQHRRSIVIAELQDRQEAGPRVQVVQVSRAGGKS